MNLDDQTRKLLDELDDEIDLGGEESEAAADLLRSLDEMKPSVPPELTGPAETPAETESQAAEPSPEYRYRVVVLLPAALESTINSAVSDLDLPGPTLGFEWQAPFRSEDPLTLGKAIDKWAREHLPIETGTERVYAEVVGSQTYLAGWKLSNDSAIFQAQKALTQCLADITTPDTTGSATFRPQLNVLPAIPADRFPQLVAYLQQHFVSQDWKIESVTLLQAPLDQDEWKIWQRFGV